MNNRYFISEARQISPALYDAIIHLIPQYSSLTELPSYSEINEIIDSETTRLFFAHEANTDKIVGSLTLVLFRLPSGVRALIEDVVVEKKYRGKGIGKLLCNAAIKKAITVNARTIDLTSRPIRKNANRLYKSVGFAVRNTKVYRIDLSEKTLYD